MILHKTKREHGCDWWLQLRSFSEEEKFIPPLLSWCILLRSVFFIKLIENRETFLEMRAAACFPEQRHVYFHLHRISCLGQRHVTCTVSNIFYTSFVHIITVNLKYSHIKQFLCTWTQRTVETALCVQNEWTELQFAWRPVLKRGFSFGLFFTLKEQRVGHVTSPAAAAEVWAARCRSSRCRRGPPPSPVPPGTCRTLRETRLSSTRPQTQGVCWPTLFFFRIKQKRSNKPSLVTPSQTEDGPSCWFKHKR